jgi:hypothetical protein
MFRDRGFFTTHTPAKSLVLLGDGQASLQIKVVGTVQCRIGSRTITIEGVCYIPNLVESI